MAIDNEDTKAVSAAITNLTVTMVSRGVEVAHVHLIMMNCAMRSLRRLGVSHKDLKRMIKDSLDVMRREG